ncbi:MAG: hypothetical protein F6K65_33595 [Moorea sp. SIO3C2]|nr:hypothetical protein [Moorena sp. SIO3C2]
MANIAISDLNPVGANLFDDSESFLMDLSDDQLDVIGLAGQTRAERVAQCERLRNLVDAL